MRQEKQLLLDEIKEKVQGAESFLLTRYVNMKANSSHEFRNQLFKVGGEYEIVRKRVFLKAMESTDLQLSLENLQGHIGIVFATQDPIETTKIVFKYGRENENSVEVLGAYIEGQLLPAKDVEMLSKLPGKQEMRSQLLATFEAPMAEFLAVLEALMTSVMHAMDNKSSKDAEGSQESAESEEPKEPEAQS
ncbi:MAG: 50S ribosomal protein L10 [Parachlamydiales bacterium]|nr:50S ribosomal protein L10 [Parachlamydiales bacterium]